MSTVAVPATSPAPQTDGYRLNLKSDNVSGAHPNVIAALAQAAQGTDNPYGDDAQTSALTATLRDLFEAPDALVVAMATGTGANALALASIAPPYGTIYCHHKAHIAVDECGAPEFFTGGAKLSLITGEHAKIDPVAFSTAITGKGIVHKVQPAALNLTQATEAGTVYTMEEVKTLTEIAHSHGLPTHMDGARFANAIARLGCSPADITWRAGIDVLSFGATKNGCLAAEALIFFKPALAEATGFRRKRAGHLVSKGRVISAQLNAYLADGLWLRMATHANRMAQKLSAGLGALAGVQIHHPVDANVIFASVPVPILDGLAADGFGFYRWADTEIRLVTSFDTPESGVDGFLASAARQAN